MIYTCKIYFQQPTTAALMERATLSKSGSHIVISKFLKYILHRLLHSIGLGNSYFRVGSRGARRIPSFPLGNTTFPTSMERYFLLGDS